jgi:hypothetical protein
MNTPSRSVHLLLRLRVRRCIRFFLLMLWAGGGLPNLRDTMRVKMNHRIHMAPTVDVCLFSILLL